MNLKSFKQFSSHTNKYQAPIAGWPQVVLMLAGAYNIVFGLWAIFLPHQYFSLNGLEPVNTNLWQCVGMIVGLYGLAYLIASSDIARFWPIVMIGLLGKIFGPIGYIFHLFTGQTNASGLVVILFNDLVWWIPFTLILLKVCNRNWREQCGIVINKRDKQEEFYKKLANDSKESKILLIFLRHFGCTFCQEALINLADNYKKIKKSGVTPYVVHMGSFKKFQDYFEFASLSDVIHVEDSEQVLYSFFNVPRGSICDVFSPDVFLEGVSLMKEKGLGVGSLEGDGFQLAACYLIDNKKIIKTHKNASAANKLDYYDFVKEDASSKGGDPKVTLYYDGDCPLCEREISILRSITPPKKVLYEDISENTYNSEKHGKSCSVLMAEIHAKDEHGNWLIGMDAFRAVYAHTPYKNLLMLTKLPIVKNVFDFGYSVFAKNRLKITGRNSSC